MDHVHPAVIDARLAEEQEYAARFQAVIGIFDPFEEHEFHIAAMVADDDGETLLRPLAGKLRGNHLGQDLDIGIPSPDIRDPHYRTSVDVPERICVQEIANGFHFQFGPQERGPFGSHSRKELHLCIKLDHSRCHKRRILTNLLTKSLISKSVHGIRQLFTIFDVP